MGGKRNRQTKVFRPVPGLADLVGRFQALARLATKPSPTSWAIFVPGLEALGY